MDNENSFEAFAIRLNEEWMHLKRCKINKEFLDVISDRLLNFLRNDPIAKKIVTNWDRQLSEEHILRRCACRELSDAVEEIRKCSQNKPMILKKLDELLEKIRSEGNYAHLKEEPVFWDSIDEGDYIYSDLRICYRCTVSNNRLTFAPSAYKFTIGWGSDVELPTQIYILSFWKKLITLADCWSLRDNVTSADVWWPRIEGDGLELWLKADHIRRQAYIKMVAGKLKCVDELNFDKAYFDREEYQKLIKFLLNEIMERLFPVDFRKCIEAKGKINIDHWRTKKHIADLETLLPIAQEHWYEEIYEKKQSPKAVTHAKIIQLLKSTVYRKGIVLKNHSKNLFVKVVKETDPRIFQGGNFIRLKSDFH